MKRYIKSSYPNEKSLTDLTDEEINALPDYFTCYTRYPGTSADYLFKAVSKSKFISSPDKCFFIDSYWGYAYPRDICIATSEDLDRHYKTELEYIQKKKDSLDKEIRNLRSHLL